jgi:DNA mismatch repair protein MutL
MSRIKVLPDAVADQIAAGEVVERPASVVKELVENSLDAGASTIVIEVEGGGRSMIRVSDDGSGMDRDDAVMALDRHATSKVSSITDLIGVPTYGFRGEALPSVASVSVLELETAVAGESGRAEEGTRVVVKGGRLETVEPTARSRGSTVTVKRLFYNTPARRKFLRSQRSETRAVVQALTVLALARLDVSFVLRSDGRVLLDAPLASHVADRIAALFGRETADGLLPVEHADGPISVRGFAQRPSEAKASGRRAYLFVNGRPFKDPFLIKAAESGYRATIPAGVRPTLFLSIGIPGDRVDVNVHPAKLEVRFRDKLFVERAVEEAIREALKPADAGAVIAGSADGGAHGDARHRYIPVGSWNPEHGHEGAGSRTEELVLDLDRGGPARLGGGAEYLQVFNTYIVFQTPEGVAIVDQHSAHERVLYERTMVELKGGSAAAQRLLLPLTIDLASGELDAIEENGDHLKAVGYEVEGFGGSSIVVHAVPNPHPRFDARRCFEELVADLAHGRLGGLNPLERFAATYACRAAVKAGDTLDQDEVRVLIQRLFACDLPPHDVHGRPTIVQLPRHELERRFGRS